MLEKIFIAEGIFYGIPDLYCISKDICPAGLLSVLQQLQLFANAFRVWKCSQGTGKVAKSIDRVIAVEIIIPQVS